ncbi:MAG: alpha/beta hydrolase [Clostridiales Family XIII bacterium]|jgi:acetyl esterase/lipase|nr:alpha/beta hydrolase [Clostridiales Family XIII bacterium]
MAAPPIRKTKFVPEWIDMGPKIPVPRIDWIKDKQLDISYGSHRLQKYDLYYPETRPEGLLPAVVIVHGGGFTHMDKRDWHMYPGFFALQEGFALISANYRLAPESKYPAAENDLIDAILHIKSHAAEWGLDADRLCLYGTSAGGNLVSVTGLKGHNENAPYAVRAVAALCPLLSFDMVRDAVRENRTSFLIRILLTYMCKKYFGSFPSRAADKMTAASAESYIGETIPPFYLQSGTLDPAIDYRDVVSFHGLLFETGNATQDNLVLDILEGAPHAGAGPEYLEPQNILPILEFFKRQF